MPLGTRNPEPFPFWQGAGDGESVTGICYPAKAARPRDNKRLHRCRANGGAAESIRES